MEIGRFKGRYIYEGKATDLRITEFGTASFFRGRRPKARPKSVKTFLALADGQGENKNKNGQKWAGSTEGRKVRKYFIGCGRATSQ